MMKLTYKITNFNEEARVLDVEFDDGSKASISLQVPLPSTLDELETIIRDFAPSASQIAARTAPSNFNFIHEIVGVEKETQRKNDAIMAPPSALVPDVKPIPEILIEAVSV